MAAPKPFDLEALIRARDMLDAADVPTENRMVWMMPKYTIDQVYDWLQQIVEFGDLSTKEDADHSGHAQATIEYLDTSAMAVDELPEGHLTEHFTLDEMIHSDTAEAQGIDNTPGADEIENLERLCQILEEVRAICDEKAVTISSGYRCFELNNVVGGAADSAHLYGLAADITIPEFGTPTAVCQKLEPYLEQLGIDQLIDESNSQGHRWVHIGLCEGVPRCESFALT